MKFSSIVVLAVIMLNLWFAKEIIELIKDAGIEPAALITAWFAFTTGELWCLKDIKKKKIDKGKEKEVQKDDN